MTPTTFPKLARAPVNPRGELPAPQSTPTTFPMHALGRRHLPPSQRTQRPQRPQRGLSDSPSDTCHFPNAYTGPCDTAAGPCGSLNDTCHLHNARKGASNSALGAASHRRTSTTFQMIAHGPQQTQCRYTATRQKIPATFPTRARALATQYGVPSGLTNDTCHLHN
ncbi:UNVERIFIED_CONTAM: hypothetical protein FKN15_043528 [Acipenser sinensis]